MRMRWYKFTSQQRKDALAKAQELFGAGKSVDHVLAAINLDVMDKARIVGVSKPVAPTPPPLPTSVPSTPLAPVAKRTKAQAIGAESDEYLALLRQLLPPSMRAQLLAAAAASPNPLMAAKAIESVDRLLMPTEGGPTVPIFELPPDTRLGFAPVVREVPVGDEALTELRERITWLLGDRTAPAPQRIVTH